MRFVGVCTSSFLRPAVMGWRRGGGEEGRGELVEVLVESKRKKKGNFNSFETTKKKEGTKAIDWIGERNTLTAMLFRRQLVLPSMHCRPFEKI